MVAAAMAVATDRTPQRMMSSSTAEPSSRLAKRVWRMPRSAKIFVMMGIDVTAAAAAKTSTTADSLPAEPVKCSSGSSGATTMAMKNGSGVPRPRIQAVGLRFSLPSSRFTAQPDPNMSSSRPRLYKKARTMVLGSLSSAPNTSAANPGATSPSRVGPRSTPARISPTTFG